MCFVDELVWQVNRKAVVEILRADPVSSETSSSGVVVAHADEASLAWVLIAQSAVIAVVLLGRFGMWFLLQLALSNQAPRRIHWGFETDIPVRFGERGFSLVLFR